MNPIKKLLLPALLLCLLLAPLSAAANGLVYVETADGARSTTIRNLVQWTHARMVFSQDLSRVAVGQSDTMEVEILGGREVLILAKEVGRTSLIVWYPDDSTETFLFSVIQDLSVLKRALHDVHPGVLLELAPDRNALVLRGTVPTVNYRVAAENVARDYLDAGNERGSGSSTLLSQGDAGADLRVQNRDSQFNGQSGSAIINLIQVEQLPSTTQEKIQAAINELGGADVTVERVMRGDVEDDATDTLILNGEVQNQVALVRVLNVASRLFLGEGAAVSSLDAVEAIADESGALINERGQGNFGQGSGNQISQQIGGGNNNNQRMDNEIRSNIGRAKLLSVANGRILSMIEVRDLPQVRVSVQLHEVNRARLKAWRPDLTAVTNDYNPESMTPGGPGLIVQPDGSQRIGASGPQQLENALQILGGTLTNHLQVGGTDLAFDLLFSLLESEGISHTLSRPTLTVLAGESALFQVGGEVPVPSSFAPSGTDVQSGGGVFSGTEFRAFGVQLAIRPMVGEDDRITLDVRPTVSMPDNALTQQIAGSTGSNLNTTAFNTRSLETTTRLRDGQPLVIAGLVSRGVSNSKNYTPGLNSIPGIGWLGKSSETSDSDRELIIIVTPTIIREPLQNVAMWQYPAARELLIRSVGSASSRDTGEGE